VIDVGGYLSRLMGVKHVWHLREFGDLDFGYSPVFGRWYEKLSYKNGDSFIAISQIVKKHYSTKISPHKIRVIYNGILLSPNLPIAKHNNSTIQFLCAGTMVEGKNQMELLKAAKILHTEKGVTNFNITFVGLHVDKEYVNSMLQYITDNGLESCCKLLGEVNGIANLASKMDAGIVPSRCEAFGRVTVEYMLQNLAVIANDQGANPEIIEDRKSGLIYKSGNIYELAECMLSLINERRLLEELSNNGRERAEKYFLSQYNSKAIYELYVKLLSN
jgi:glycosyltransferase involved in cell wall biosynthesis